MLEDTALVSAQNRAITTSPIDSYSSSHAILPQADCEAEQQNQYFGHALELQIQDIGAESAVSTVRSARYTLSGDNDTEVYEDNDMRIVSMNISESRSSYERLAPIVHAAITHEPTYIQDAINYFRVDNNTVGTGAFRRLNISSNSNDTDVRMLGLTNVYINLIHNCDTVCVTSEINGNNSASITRHGIMRDSMLCLQEITQEHSTELTAKYNTTHIRRASSRGVDTPLRSTRPVITTVPTILTVSAFGLMGILLMVYMVITDYPGARRIHERISRIIRGMRRIPETTTEDVSTHSREGIEDMEAQVQDEEYMYTRVYSALNTEEDEVYESAEEDLSTSVNE